MESFVVLLACESVGRSTSEEICQIFNNHTKIPKNTSKEHITENKENKTTRQSKYWYSNKENEQPNKNIIM
jgi:hypothetical protein